MNWLGLVRSMLKAEERNVHRQILETLLASEFDRDVNNVKLKVSKIFRLSRIPSNSEVLSVASRDELGRAIQRLQLKRVRSLSGINVVSVMCRPAPCPHGHCAYCPEEPGVPNSYTGFEPAAMRGIQNEFDPYRQAKSRLSQLRAIGHSINKIELIIQGGTFTAQSLSYQEYFVKRCLDALTDVESLSLEEAKRNAERSSIRNVGLTIETRPDWAKEKHVDNMLRMGATRVEIGVQTLDDEIYRLVERGHTVADVAESFRILKDSSFKIVAHMMPGLPGATPEKDLESFKRLFIDSEFRPDMIKIYPCLVVEGTKIYEWWKRGEYRPYSTDEAVQLIAKIKEFVPPWIRVMRIQREIPRNLIVAGADKSNLRELIHGKLRAEGKRCLCIRCREVGHKAMKEGISPDPRSIKIRISRYEASSGIENFIEAVDESSDALVGYIRLRMPSDLAHRPEIAHQNAALVRELHVYGQLVPIGEKAPKAWQHRGWGRQLLEEAERITAEEFDRTEILVISALGTKEYYRRFGYLDDGPYVSKLLS